MNSPQWRLDVEVPSVTPPAWISAAFDTLPATGGSLFQIQEMDDEEAEDR